ncbi:unnamed protein product [Parascedosporium putredinis]|uniref:U4/U6 snRNA-associated-splicing factor PRP24 n=1 Tax=Parascedosporium putredinis TaxID=1442378 RepID=A0A9P1H406_9PEZI|nr:unnamed protein product [Parascedosporium putredinis]CAI7995273.1 unnamed protein product [Parascedosporium putredinis]
MTPVASDPTNPVGQDNWVAYVEEACRTANDLEKRVNAIELYKRAISAEPGSLRIWRAYCEYFHSLYVACQTADPSWSGEELMMGREIFSLDADLQLWQSAYEDRFSSFLSEYNRQSWESTMKQVTADAQGAKAILGDRERFEFRLEKAVRAHDIEAEGVATKEYLAWEIAQTRTKDEGSYMRDDLCRGLFSRALTAEEAGLSFAEIEQIKHAATNNSQIYRDGLTSLLEMYVAWCGYLKRTAMNPTASEEAIDVADVGLPAALESVDVLGKRLYDDQYQGDPDFRLERIYIQYLTEKEGDLDEARTQWEKLARKSLYSDRYDFWRAYYLWEMQIFFSQPKSHLNSAPTSDRPIPGKATVIISRAVNQKTLDWPERAISAYLQHCNDYESPNTIRRARDNVHKVRIVVAKRREREAEEAAAAYAQQAEAHQQALAASGVDTNPLKRTILFLPIPHQAPKESAATPSVRDREHTTVLINNLPADATQTAIKKYLKDFGRIQNITLVQNKDTDTSTALVEFASVQDATDAISFRDSKYFGQNQIRVTSGAKLTVFVTNYPPVADDEYMRSLFKECGDILSVRWPSLKFNTRRRFCYLSFRDQEASAKAVKLDGKVLEGTFKLEVKYSDPAKKKKREGAVSEGREVRVSNLDDSLKEEDIRDVFSKYGGLTRVNLVESRRGKGYSSMFLEYEKKEYAERAVAELNNTKLRSRILSVELAVQPKTKVSAKVINPAAREGSPRDAEGDEVMQDGGTPTEAGGAQTRHSGPVSARKIALMNLPETINHARVEALLKPVGAFHKLVYQPGKGTAVVEFFDEATAGRASLQLDGAEIEGVKIQTGSLADLARFTKAAPEEGAPSRQASDKDKGKKVSAGSGPATGAKPVLMQPVTVRRPVLGRGAVQAQRRGIPKAGSEESDAQKTESKPKSNAEFKAMFLSDRPGVSESKKDTV